MARSDKRLSQEHTASVPGPMFTKRIRPPTMANEYRFSSETGQVKIKHTERLEEVVSDEVEVSGCTRCRLQE